MFNSVWSAVKWAHKVENAQDPVAKQILETIERLSRVDRAYILTRCEICPDYTPLIEVAISAVGTGCYARRGLQKIIQNHMAFKDAKKISDLAIVYDLACDRGDGLAWYKEKVREAMKMVRDRVHADLQTRFLAAGLLKQELAA